MDYLNTILGSVTEVIVGAALAYFITSFELYKQHQKEISNIREEEAQAIRLGMQALLRDRIIQAYNHYIPKGWIPIYAKESVMNCYDNYEKLGANGVINDLIAQLKELPNSEAKL